MSIYLVYKNGDGLADYMLDNKDYEKIKEILKKYEKYGCRICTETSFGVIFKAEVKPGNDIFDELSNNGYKVDLRHPIK